MNHRRITFIILAAFCLFGPKAASALTLAPPSFDLSLDPGGAPVVRTIKLMNDAPQPVTVYPDVLNFTFKEGDESSGLPVFYPAGETKTGRELAPWMNISKKPITLLSGERVSIDVTVTAPKDGQPGSHFGAVIFKDAPASAEGGVGLVSGAGVLLLARVSGNVVESLRISQFGGGATVYSHLPIDFKLRVENAGTAHLRPFGEIRVTNVFGRQVAALAVNEGGTKSVLPGSARRFEVSWARQKLAEGASEYARQWQHFAFGRYKATLLLHYGESTQTVGAGDAFWVVPWMALLTIFGGAMLLIKLLSMILQRLHRKTAS
jgi:hypothetical protein